MTDQQSVMFNEPYTFEAFFFNEEPITVIYQLKAQEYACLLEICTCSFEPPVVITLFNSCVKWLFDLVLILNNSELY